MNPHVHTKKQGHLYTYWNPWLASAVHIDTYIVWPLRKEKHAQQIFLRPLHNCSFQKKHDNGYYLQNATMDFFFL
jgi:hypothetical protein